MPLYCRPCLMRGVKHVLPYTGEGECREVDGGRSREKGEGSAVSEGGIGESCGTAAAVAFAAAGVAGRCCGDAVSGDAGGSDGEGAGDGATVADEPVVIGGSEGVLGGEESVGAGPFDGWVWQSWRVVGLDEWEFREVIASQ